MCSNMLFKMKMIRVYYKLIYYIHKETALKINVVSCSNIIIKEY